MLTLPFLTLMAGADPPEEEDMSFTSDDRNVLLSIQSLLRVIVPLDTTVESVINSRTFILAAGTNSYDGTFDQRTVLLYDASNSNAIASGLSASWDRDTRQLELLVPPPFTVAPGDRVVFLATRDVAFSNPIAISQ